MNAVFVLAYYYKQLAYKINKPYPALGRLNNILPEYSRGILCTTWVSLYHALPLGAYPKLRVFMASGLVVRNTGLASGTHFFLGPLPGL